MASRMKEDERNEKIIRGLLKLPANRRCINCNNLGPQYVCINFWTFICTNCSGMHREFTHRVKSISMAKFTSQEVISLQEGGNECAKEIYFKEWDLQRHMFPDSRNIDKLRDFIKHVYVERRYSGGRNNDKPPRVKGDRDDLNENKRGDSYKGGSRSPPYDDRYSERAGYGGRNESRSPGYDGDYKTSPGRYERRQDDRFGSGNQNRKFEDRRLPDGASKPEGGSPNNQKDIAASSPPMIHPVRDILGNDMPTLRVSNPPKSNGARIPDNSAQAQRTLSSSSMGSTDGTSTQLKGISSGSLIDFNADPEPPALQTPQQSVPQRSLSAPADGGNWASFDISVQQKAPQPPQAVPNATTIESELLQLSAPGSGHGGNMSILPVRRVESFPKATNGPMMQQQPPITYTASNSQFTNTQFSAPTAGAVNQSLYSSLAPNLQSPLTAPAGHSYQVSTRQFEEKNAGLSLQPPVDAKSNGRKELPEDLFTFTYPSAPTSAPGWQRGPHVGIGYGMQYPAGMVQMIPVFTHAPKASNPFDLNEPTSVQSPRFPSMTPLQGALPNVTSVSPLSHTSTNFGTILPWMLPQQPPPYPPVTSQSPYMMQQVPGNVPQVLSNMIPTLYQGIGGPGVGAHFGSSSMDQLPAARFSQPGTPNSFGPVGSNPFG